MTLFDHKPINLPLRDTLDDDIEQVAMTGFDNNVLLAFMLQQIRLLREIRDLLKSQQPPTTP